MPPRTLLPAICCATGLITGSAGCARRVPAAPPSDRVAIVASEKSADGARLVAIDERGDRQFELVQPATRLCRDANPTVSPDGRWLVFASSRDRSLDQTSLWLVPLGATMPPRRLTDGTGIDAHPVWTPDGAAIVFASTRDGGEFDLWRLAIHGGQPGALTRLTRARGHEVTPSVAPDGTIVYAAVTPDLEHREIETHLEERTPDGAIHRLTAGPADSSPAVSPDGARLVFARPQIHGGKPDSELWLMMRGSGATAPLVDLPLTDESGPVWSRDGRFVFATSVLRGHDGRVVFSSIIHVDTRDKQPVARILEDRVGAMVRLTPAVTATPLDAAVLDRDPEYLPELARIMTRWIEQQTQPEPEPAPASPHREGR